MQKQKIIILNKIIFFFRDQAKELGEAIRKANFSEVMIDFSGVDFISRSFADEWLNVLEKITSKKTVVIRHAKPEIKKMIQIVRKKRQEINKQLSS
jgi:anti-anti-sigma regulatory factor